MKEFNYSLEMKSRFGGPAKTFVFKNYISKKPDSYRC